jgi:LPS export ABC transporter protein LptC
VQSAGSARATAPALHITSEGTARQPVRAFQQIHNRRVYELIASSAESTGPQGKTRAVFRNARVTFHDRTGATMTATAPRAIVDETTNVVTLIDGVHARTSSGMQLQCNTLDYDKSTAMLHGNGNVVMLDPNGFRGTGSSFDSDLSLTHVQMK